MVSTVLKRMNCFNYFDPFELFELFELFLTISHKEHKHKEHKTQRLYLFWKKLSSLMIVGIWVLCLLGLFVKPEIVAKPDGLGLFF